MAITLPESIGEIEKQEERDVTETPWTQTGVAAQKYTYYVIDKEAEATRTGKGWFLNPYKWTATVTFGYYKYTRTTVTQTKTSETQRVQATYGLVGWEINGKEYKPGETYIVSGVVTAKPVIGEVKDAIALGQPSVTTQIRTIATDTYDGYETGKVEKTGLPYDNNVTDKGAQAAKDTVLALYNDKKPSGYEWFDASKPTYDGHYDEPRID